MLNRNKEGTPDLERCCDVCHSADSKRVDAYSEAQWPLVECLSCGFIYLKQVPEYEALSDELAWEKQHAQEAKRRRKSIGGALDAATRWRLVLGKMFDDRVLTQQRRSSGNILDVGCAGTCANVPLGATPFGIEVSEALARKAAPEFEARGGQVFHGPAHEGLDCFEGIQFSSVYMRSYLEHEAQPRIVLEKAFKRLEPGGTVHLRVPNFGSPNRIVMGRRWSGFRFPDHVNYFTSPSLRRLAESIGFQYRRVNGWSLFDDNLMVVLTKPASS
ncbi:MAG: class I SAM-dependent methyltransferase [Alphaproteobacteria bacterium]|nr:class I SAM-dependent methyltransferase [Alphaproteobacteria bacterium]